MNSQCVLRLHPCYYLIRSNSGKVAGGNERSPLFSSASRSLTLPSPEVAQLHKDLTKSLEKLSQDFALSVSFQNLSPVPVLMVQMPHGHRITEGWWELPKKSQLLPQHYLGFYYDCRLCF